VPRAHTWTPGVRRVGGRWCRARLLTTTRAALCGRVSAHARALSSPVDHDVGVVLGVLSSCATRSKRSSARRDCRARYIGSTRSSVRCVFLSNIVTYFEQVQGQNPRAGMTSRFTSVSKASHGHGKEAGSKKRGRPSTSETLGGPVAQGALTSFFRRTTSIVVSRVQGPVRQAATASGVGRPCAWSASHSRASHCPRPPPSGKAMARLITKSTLRLRF